jgi:iron complex outermembrane receptor protein
MPFNTKRCSLLLLTALGTSVHAQNANPDMADVVVKSGRLEQKQFDAPASVYTLDAEAIRSSGPQVNLSDALAGAPGVVALNRNNYAQDVQISIRGFGARSAFGIRGIRLIADGIPATIPDGQGQASTVSLTSADRIEVLTGPLAQLYGNSAGGVIQTFTREAGDTPVAQSQLFVGSYGMTRTDWQISQRSGTVGLVADYSTFAIDGYRNNSDTRRQQFNGVITMDAQPGTRIKLIANLFDMPYAKDPLGLSNISPSYQLSTNPAQAGNFAVANGTQKTVKQEQIGTVIEHKINPELMVQGRLYSGTRDNLQYQATSATAGGWVSLARQFAGVGLQVQGKQRLQADQALDWVVGYEQDTSKEQRQGGSATAGVQTGALNRNELDTATNKDVFAQANLHLIPDWTFTTGVRQSTVQLSSRDDLTHGASSGSATYRATNPVLGATWHVLETLNLYANQGKGFETPTLSETAYQKGISAPLLTFNPNLLAATSKHLEMGSKWTPAKSTRIDAAWFRIRTDDEIVTAQSVSGKSAYTNAGQTLRQGIELAARQQFNDHWRAQLSATYLRATYENYVNYLGANYSGNTLPGVPNKQLFSSITWSEKGFQTLAAKPVQGTEVTLDWAVRSTMWATDSNATTSAASGYGIMNLRMRERFLTGPAQWEAYLGINNLTDQKTVGSVIINQSSSQFFEPGLPRNWVIGLAGKLPL